LRNIVREWFNDREMKATEAASLRRRPIAKQGEE
jgi:hypothetical protein